jgi:hypothetical protein
MILEIHNMIPVGLNVGFEIYGKEEGYEYYELQINLLIIKLVFKWQ